MYVCGAKFMNCCLLIFEHVRLDWIDLNPFLCLLFVSAVDRMLTASLGDAREV